MADPASWHSHVYFDAASHPRAEALVAAMQQHFGPEADITYGRWHHRPVTTFLAQNRDGLTIFTHPNTGATAADELRDHRDHAVWMGEVRPLKLSLFGGEDQA